MIYNLSGFPCSDELYHHGILGQKWGVRRFQNTDGTLTAEGKIRYGSSDSLGSRIKRVIDERAESKRQKLMKTRPWLMTDDELKNSLNRINMEKQYLAALKEVEKDDKRVRNWVNSMLEKGATTLATKAFEAVGNKIVAEQRLKDDAAYAKKMAKIDAKADAKYAEKMAVVSAKNKLRMDKIIDEGQRKQTENDASSKYMRSIEKNYQTMNNDELDYAIKKWENLKRIENRYRGSEAKTDTKRNKGNNRNKGGGN